VGKGGGSSGTVDVLRLPRGATALFRFRGDAFLDGDEGSLGAMLSSGSNICDGSIPSPVFALRLRAFLVGDASTFAVVWRREDFLGLRFGAGVNSSSSGALKLISSSDSSTMTFLRAARRVGLVGETVAMLTMFRRCWRFRDSEVGCVSVDIYLIWEWGPWQRYARPSGGRATSPRAALHSVSLRAYTHPIVLNPSMCRSLIHHKRCLEQRVLFCCAPFSCPSICDIDRAKSTTQKH